MGKEFRPGEILTLEKERKQSAESDQLETEFTTGEIMPKDRYLGNKSRKSKGSKRNTFLE